MRISGVVKVAVVAASAGAVLAGCTSSSDDEASPSPSTESISAEAVDVAGTIASIKEVATCESWTGGKAAGEGVLAGWQYVCDQDGDLVAEATLSIYLTTDSLERDVAEIEAASADTGIVQGDHYIFATTDPAQFDAVVDLGGEVVREMP
ncbi:hypothetical protein [Demequina silvatica]|uniref:hypothetical protein n=1 Tax=Demequina silvatica TaxID=1638988 RepID=UPI000783278F|nr:hypothetical protein [Demequina silvatica]